MAETAREPHTAASDADPMAPYRDALMRACEPALRPSGTVQDFKRVVMVAFKALPPEDRISFRNKIDPDGNLITFKTRWPDKNDPDLEHAAREWPYVMAAGTDGHPGFFGPLAERDGQKPWGFAKSIQANLRRRNWTPSEGQRNWMVEIHQQYRRWLRVK